MTEKQTGKVAIAWVVVRFLCNQLNTQWPNNAFMFFCSLCMVYIMHKNLPVDSIVWLRENGLMGGFSAFTILFVWNIVPDGKSLFLSASFSLSYVQTKRGYTYIHSTTVAVKRFPKRFNCGVRCLHFHVKKDFYFTRGKQKNLKPVHVLPLSFISVPSFIREVTKILKSSTM